MKIGGASFCINFHFIFRLEALFRRAFTFDGFIRKRLNACMCVSSIVCSTWNLIIISLSLHNYVNRISEIIVCLSSETRRSWLARWQSSNYLGFSCEIRGEKYLGKLNLHLAGRFELTRSWRLGSNKEEVWSIIIANLCRRRQSDFVIWIDSACD